MTQTVWPDYVGTVLRRLSDVGHEAYAVGGCVRDMVLQRPVHDYDIATNARPEQVLLLFPGSIPTGIQHATVTVLSDGKPVEVTTYRVDLGYSDGRRPDDVAFAHCLEADLARRDFTINAMAMDLDGELVDPFGGRADLAARVIRAVGCPAERFREDGLRIIRAVRFAAQLSFYLHPQTFAGMQAEADRLGCVSKERIGQEFLKIAACDWWQAVPLLADGEFLSTLDWPLSQLAAGFRRIRESRLERFGFKLDYDIAEICKEWTDGFHPLIPVLSVWLYAAGAPPDAARRLTRQMAWRKEWGHTIASTLQWLERPLPAFTEFEWRRAMFDTHPFAVQLACAIYDTWQTAHGKSSLTFHACRDVWKRLPIQSIADLRLTGHDLAALGLFGPTIGAAKRRLAEAVLVGKLPNEREQLLDAARVFAVPSNEEDFS